MTPSTKKPKPINRPSTIVISDWLANCQVGQWTPFEAATALKAALRKEGYVIVDAATNDPTRRDSGIERALELLVKLQTIGNAKVYRLASEAHQMLTRERRDIERGRLADDWRNQGRLVVAAVTRAGRQAPDRA